MLKDQDGDKYVCVGFTVVPQIEGIIVPNKSLYLFTFYNEPGTLVSAFTSAHFGDRPSRK